MAYLDPASNPGSKSCEPEYDINLFVCMHCNKKCLSDVTVRLLNKQTNKTWTHIQSVCNHSGLSEVPYSAIQ